MSVAYSDAIPADRNEPVSRKSREGRWVEGKRFKLPFARWGDAVQHDNEHVTKHSTPRSWVGLHVLVANVDARLLDFGPVQPAAQKETVSGRM